MSDICVWCGKVIENNPSYTLTVQRAGRLPGLGSKKSFRFHKKHEVIMWLERSLKKDED